MPGRAEELAARGYYFSLAGNVTFPKAVDLQEAARTLPADRILVETDAPYLTPVPRRGRPNTPAMVAHTYTFLAKLRGIDLSVFAAQVQENAARAFPRLTRG